ncbi:MAG: hypothetical protein QW176_01220 [Candidatus Bathyarchaeia archaeon]
MVRVSKELKDGLGGRGVEVSRVVRMVLGKGLKRRRLERLKEAADELGRFFRNTERGNSQNCEGGEEGQVMYILDSSAIAIILKRLREDTLRPWKERSH